MFSLMLQQAPCSTIDCDPDTHVDNANKKTAFCVAAVCAANDAGCCDEKAAAEKAAAGGARCRFM